MKTYHVLEKPDVFYDYVAIATHIETWTGDRALADRTVDAIRAFIKSFRTLPHRGMKGDDLRSGGRIVAFRKWTAIAIEIDDEAGTMTVLRVFYGGQDYETVLGGNAD